MQQNTLHISTTKTRFAWLPLIHFDETPCDMFSSSDDFHDEVWALFRRRAKMPADMDALTALENLHLIRDGKMTQAGAWLLARDIRKFNTSGDVA